VGGETCQGQDVEEQIFASKIRNHNAMQQDAEGWHNCWRLRTALEDDVDEQIVQTKCRSILDAKTENSCWNVGEQIVISKM